MKFKKILTISGRISSGKTYVAELIHKEYGFPVASFGGYLKHYCEINKLSINRKALQDIGQKFVNEMPKQFISDVLSFFAGGSEIIILEGIRHKLIFEQIPLIAEKHLSVFIEADLNTRYERYYSRIKDSDSVKTFDQFKIAESHLVEIDIQALKDICDITIDSSKEFWPELKRRIEIFL